MVLAMGPLGSPEILVVLLFLLPTSFWLWMLVDCLTKERNGSEKTVWLLLILLGNFFGAAIYFFMRRLKRREGGKPVFCPKCGADNDSSQSYCRGCGHLLPDIKAYIRQRVEGDGAVRSGYETGLENSPPVVTGASVTEHTTELLEGKPRDASKDRPTKG
jgi:hypothetical protein